MPNQPDIDEVIARAGEAIKDASALQRSEDFAARSAKMRDRSYDNRTDIYQSLGELAELVRDLALIVAGRTARGGTGQLEQAITELEGRQQEDDL